MNKNKVDVSKIKLSTWYRAARVVPYSYTRNPETNEIEKTWKVQVKYLWWPFWENLPYSDYPATNREDVILDAFYYLDKSNRV